MDDTRSVSRMYVLKSTWGVLLENTTVHSNWGELSTPCLCFSSVIERVPESLSFAVRIGDSI